MNQRSLERSCIPELSQAKYNMSLKPLATPESAQKTGQGLFKSQRSQNEDAPMAKGIKI
jgi:hypothetical protein